MSPTILSVCRTLPTPSDPTAGVFVLRRLQAISCYTHLRILQPIPYFPILRPLPDWANGKIAIESDVEIVRAPMFYVPKFLKSLDSRWLHKSITRTVARMKNFSIDLLDAHFGYPDGVASVLAAKEYDIPVFVTIRGVEEEYLRVPNIAKQLMAALRAADGCICVSHSLKKTVLAAGVEANDIKVIHNAVNREIFFPACRTKSRAELGVSESVPLVVSVGNLLSVKRHDVLLRAVAKLGPSVRLIVIGAVTHEPRQLEKLQQVADQLGISERVTFTGGLAPAAVARWLSAANVFALASAREGCCNALLEALACGCPAVVTAVGDNSVFVRDGSNGYLVSPGNINEMAERLSEALQAKDWDRDHIVRSLPVGNWQSVGRATLSFFSQRTGMRFD